MAVAETQGEFVGYLQITFISGLSRNAALRGQSGAVRISPRLRGRGIGREFLNWAIST